MDPITIALAERSQVAKAFFFGSIPLEIEDHSWRVEVIKDFTTLYALREVRHCYAIYQRRLPLDTNNEEPFLMEVNPLEDKLLKVGSGNSKPKRLGCITLKYEPLQCIFCLGERSLKNRQKTPLFNCLDSLQQYVKTYTKGYIKRDIVYCPHFICRKYKIYSNSISHFKNHIALVYNIFL